MTADTNTATTTLDDLRQQHERLADLLCSNGVAYNDVELVPHSDGTAWTLGLYAQVAYDPSCNAAEFDRVGDGDDECEVYGDEAAAVRAALAHNQRRLDGYHENPSYWRYEPDYVDDYL